MHSGREKKQKKSSHDTAMLIKHKKSTDKHVEKLNISV